MAPTRQASSFSKTARALALACCAALLLFSGCLPTTGDIEALQNQVARLEKQQGDLSRRVGQMEEKAAAQDDNLKKQNQEVLDRVARMGLATDAARSDIQKLSGQVEELNHTMGLSSGPEAGKSLPALAKEQDALGQRLTRVEAFLNLSETPEQPVSAPLAPAAGASSVQPVAPAVSAPLAPAAAAVPVPAAPAAGMPQEEGPAYSYAKEALDRGELSVARERFTEFMKRFPKSSYSDNALFWVGETYFLQKDYQKAILEYQKVIEQFPKGNKVPAALLKQGLAFARLNDSSNAKIILDDLIRRYPQSPEALVAKKQLKRL